MSSDWHFYKQHGTAIYECWYPTSTLKGVIVVSLTSFSANTLYAMPYIESRGGIVDRIGIRSSAVASNLRLGIYDNLGKGNLYPGNLILDSGSLSRAGGGNINATTSVVYNPNSVYWEVLLMNSTDAVSASAGGGGMYSLLGIDPTDFTTFRYGWTIAQPYGPMPTTFPGAASFLAGPSATNFPVIFIRYATDSC